MTDYTMDHSSYIYLIGPDGYARSLYGADSTAADLVAGITAAQKI
jgi:protein SCO1/2